MNSVQSWKSRWTGMLETTVPDLVEKFRRDGYVIARGIVPSDVIGPLARFIIQSAESYWPLWRRFTNASFDDVGAVSEWLARLLADPAGFAALPDDIRH